MGSARWMLFALLVASPGDARAETWPYSARSAADRACVDRHYCHGSPSCLARYDQMVSEQGANSYRDAVPDPGESRCVGEVPERCRDSEALAIGRLAAIYDALAEDRAAAEIGTYRKGLHRVRARWERLLWCRGHYEPALGPSSYEDVLRCYDPRATRDLRDPDAPPYRDRWRSSLYLVGYRDCLEPGEARVPRRRRAKAPEIPTAAGAGERPDGSSEERVAGP